MIKSMTGYGKAVCERPDKKLTIEIKSLNSKGLDLNCRIPYLYKEKELELRSLISENLVRGKVDFSVYSESTDITNGKTINKPIVKAYYTQLAELADELSLEKGPALLQSVMKLPDTLNAEAEELTAEEWADVKSAAIEAVKSISSFREHEGAALKTDLELRISNIEQQLEAIIPFEQPRVEKIKDRIKKALEEQVSSENVDNNRFEQELIFYIEKLDITEEKVRLRQHCKYFIENINSEESSVGRKLNFIAQEIGREINTIGSKANDADIQKLVIRMKDELEKIKEQSLNIL